MRKAQRAESGQAGKRHEVRGNQGGPLQVVVAGIEADIPVTYGTGSQRGAGHWLSVHRSGPCALCHGEHRGARGASADSDPTPDNSSPTGTTVDFHMELLLQGVAA